MLHIFLAISLLNPFSIDLSEKAERCLFSAWHVIADGIATVSPLRSIAFGDLETNAVEISGMVLEGVDALSIDKYVRLARTYISGTNPFMSNTVERIIRPVSVLFALTLILLTRISRGRVFFSRNRLFHHRAKRILPVLLLIIFISGLNKNFLSPSIDAGLVKEISMTVLYFSLGILILTIIWPDEKRDDLGRIVILAVGAHPDDIELGCGAYIMKTKDRGARVYSLTMTRGEKGTSENGKRELESLRAAKFMSLDGFWVYNFKDTELMDYVSQMKDVIEEKIREVGANVVLTHTAIDIHNDHKAVFEATKVAARKSVSILCYEDVSTPREFVPNHFVDVTGYIEDKMRLIEIHKTQSGKTYMNPETIKGRAAHRGLQSGVPYAEAFRAYKFML